MEQREQQVIHPDFIKAKAFIKQFMINFDEFYPDEELKLIGDEKNDALREKKIARTVVMDVINNIVRIKIKNEDALK